MIRPFVRADDGQAMVIVGLGLVVLIGALALTADWGYGFALRRGMQNEADAAALGAGRLLASSFAFGNPMQGSSPSFQTTKEAAWCEARRLTTPATQTLELSFSDDGATFTDAISGADCTPPIAGDPVPPRTVYVRVVASTSFWSLFAVVTRQQVGVASAARARLTAGAALRPLQLPPLPAGERGEVPGMGLSGGTTAPSVAIWPIALHFDPQLRFAGSPCGQYCDDPSRLLTLFGPGADQPFGSFGGLVSLGHHSLRDDAYTHQLITESDYRGSSEDEQGHPKTAPFVNKSGKTCDLTSPPNGWDTRGSFDPSIVQSCDLPNVFHYGFGGSIGLGTNWADPGWNPYRVSAEIGTDLPTRSTCNTPGYFALPSCAPGSSMIGDWVETVDGGLTVAMATQMRDFIQRYGRETPASATNGLGKAVVVHVLFWDCAEHFDGTEPAGQRWDLVPGRDDNNTGQDCSQLSHTPNRTVDRVHLVTAIPFTFYEGLIAPDASSVQAYWGDAFGQPGFYKTGNAYASCGADQSDPACKLNPLMNSAFLVPDE